VTRRAVSAALALALVAASAAATEAQPDTVRTRVAALVGLARTARDQGRVEASAAHFRNADRTQPLAGALLVEYFWAARLAGAGEAPTIGARVLAANPRERNVRDGLVGLLAARGDEAEVTRLVDEGRALEPTSALWVRRLAESHLRSGRPGPAAEAFKTATTLAGAEPQDLAQWAFALELAGNQPGAARAWSTVPPALVSSRSDWVESRARALAPAPTPQVRSATAPALTPDGIRLQQVRALAERPCDVEPLAVLERMPESGAFIDAVAIRPVDCADRAAWASRAVERAIADSAFERALALARPAATAGSPVAIREQLGVLLHWTGAHAEAAPILREVVDEDPAQARATTALIEVLRALGDSEGAWMFAERVWGASGEVEDRISLAELALESGHQAQALTLARALRADDIVGERAAAVEGRALLNLGRPAEARRVLEPLGPAPAASLAWLDAVAATDGADAALASAARLPIGSSPAWAAVNGRRAVWHARLGHRVEAERLVQAVEAVDPIGAALTRGEIALAASRPADAERAFQGVLRDQPDHLRALDGLSTALAEQGRWDEALATLSAIQMRRASELHWEIRMAEWRYRQAPTDLSLDRLRTLAIAHPVPDARSALARACFAAGLYECALEALGADLTTLSEHDAVLAARSLRGAGRSAEAVALLRARRTLPVDGVLLRAELLAALEGPAAAHADFQTLTDRSDADPGWYLAWADAQHSGGELMRILDAAITRFPLEARLQERLAVAAWAAGDEGTALRAAEAALRADDGRAGAWFVKVEIASGRGASAELLALLGRFEVRFASEPSARIGMAEMLAGLTRSSDDPAARRALGWVEAILADQPQHAAAAVARARLYAGLGEWPQAMRVVDDLVAARPELPAALKLKAELLAVTGRYADAVVAYDDYLARAPRDLEARRQQARIEGWRGAYGESLARYERLCDSDLRSPAVAAERDAKRAYYRGSWADAVRRYDAWLALEPGNIEAQLERAQALDHLGEAARARDAFGAIAASAAPNDVSLTAAERIGRRQQASVDVFAVAQSANAIERRQLLDLVDSGAGVSDDLGLGFGTRARVFGGPSMADVGSRIWRGNHVGGQFVTSPVAPLMVNGSIAYRTLDTAGGQWFGDAGVTWRAHATLRLTGGLERSLLLENGLTLAEGISGVGPTAGVRWSPNTDFNAQASGTRSDLSDGNQRHTLRLSASERVLRGPNELRLVLSSEFLGYQAERLSYFTPSSFWRHDVGAEWRGWLATPRFFGDRERWVSAAYLYGGDDRGERYHTGRAGLSYELASGVSVVADGLLVRSRVYNGGRLSFGLRFKHVAMPQP
jgi:tetratricopeptide (TPR) repeat protein